MSKRYNPSDWFWLADDGRVFGSNAGSVTDAKNAAYKAWTSDGSVATPWPRDEAGEQTDAALYEVLAPYGLAPASPAPVITYKADIYRRCTDTEADEIEMALAQATTRQRRLFEESQYLDHSDPVFATMHTAMVGMFGEDRTAVLLAAS